MRLVFFFTYSGNCWFTIRFLGLQMFTQILLIRGVKLSSLPVVIRCVLFVCSDSKTFLMKLVGKATEYYSPACELCEDADSQSQLKAIKSLGRQLSLPINLGAGVGHVTLLMNRAISKGKTQKGSIPPGYLMLPSHPTQTSVIWGKAQCHCLYKITGLEGQQSLWGPTLTWCGRSCRSAPTVFPGFGFGGVFR